MHTFYLQKDFHAVSSQQCMATPKLTKQTKSIYIVDIKSRTLDQVYVKISKIQDPYISPTSTYKPICYTKPQNKTVKFWTEEALTSQWKCFAL